MEAEKSTTPVVAKKEKRRFFQKQEAEVKAPSGPVFTHPKKNPWAMGGQVFWTSIIAILATTTIVGASMYFYQAFFYEKQIREFSFQIETLNEQIELGAILAYVREGVASKASCPLLRISDSKKYILADGLPLDFTDVEQGETGKNIEITSVAKNADCGEMAIGLVDTREGSGSATIRRISLDGTEVQNFALYDLPNDVTIKEFKDNLILYAYWAHGAGLDAGELQQAANIAFLNTQTGAVEEWGKAYAYSADWNYIVAVRDGAAVLVDMRTDQDLAVLYSAGQDYATDFVFSSDGASIAYLHFPERQDTAFLGNYFNLCGTEPVEGKISVWDIDAGLKTDIMGGDIRGIRLTSFSGNVIYYTKWGPDAVKKSLTLP
ncbi:hypothetical protein KJ969_00325 [Patescibacteria group bacterium]|nr:hypothetical protein [Patescibacteria group bacterium]MBU1922529.1 hypothetical protein [Patescibacteria group bacterium]